MAPPILFRLNDRDSREEYEVAQKYFKCYTSRTKLSRENTSDLVVGRYSVLPYYKEVNDDVGNCLVNSILQHEFITTFDWYGAVRDYTPKSWFEGDFHGAPEGQYVVKGKITSKKHLFNKQMFAPTKKDALRIAADLRQDLWLCDQGIVFREFVPLNTFEVGINGLPFTNEWRFFFLKEWLVDYGYYWSIAETIPDSIPAGGIEFAQKMAGLIAPYVNFFVVDIALTKEGQWIMIELNDGQQSGLSEIPPKRFYKNLFEALTEFQAGTLAAL